MNDKYYYYSKLEEGWLTIPSKLLYSLWDVSNTVVIEGDGVSREVLTGDYKGFECKEDEDYRIARFKIGQKSNQLDSFRLKLLKDYKIHHEWFNILYSYWKSEEFILILTKISELRKSNPSISPSREDQFNFLKERIISSVIRDDITDVGVDIWKPFVAKLRQIQEDKISKHKKFDS